jgi:hypothetical protein
MGGPGSSVAKERLANAKPTDERVGHVGSATSRNAGSRETAILALAMPRVGF